MLRQKSAIRTPTRIVQMELSQYDKERLPETAQLIADAIEKHGVEIAPAGRFSRFRDCLDTNEAISILWYNDNMGSTHLVKRKK